MSWKDVKDFWDDCWWLIILFGIIVIIAIIGIIWIFKDSIGGPTAAIILAATAIGWVGSASKSRMCSILSTIIKTIICIYLFRLLSTYTDLHASTTDQRVASFGLKMGLIWAVVWSYVMMFCSFSDISKKEKEEKKRLQDAEIERLNAERDYYKAQTAKQKQ